MKATTLKNAPATFYEGNQYPSANCPHEIRTLLEGTIDNIQDQLKMLARSNKQLKLRLKQAQQAFQRLQVAVSKQPQST